MVSPFTNYSSLNYRGWAVFNFGIDIFKVCAVEGCQAKPTGFYMVSGGQSYIISLCNECREWIPKIKPVTVMMELIPEDQAKVYHIMLL